MCLRLINLNSSAQFVPLMRESHAFLYCHLLHRCSLKTTLMTPSIVATSMAWVLHTFKTAAEIMTTSRVMVRRPRTPPPVMGTRPQAPRPWSRPPVDPGLQNMDDQGRPELDHASHFNALTLSLIGFKMDFTEL